MFIKACYSFLEYLKGAKNASDHTVRNYSIDLNELKCFLEKEYLKDVEKDKHPEKIRYNASYNEREKSHDHLLDFEIDRKMIRGFLAHLNYEGKSKKTIVRRLSSIRTFFKYAQASGHYPVNPTEEIETLKIERKIPTPLTFEQLQRLFSQPDTTTYLGFRDRTIMELFYSSGLRISELAGMNREDFYPSEFLIRLRGKGKKERIVPITKNAAHWVQNYLDHEERHEEINGHRAQIDQKAIFLNKWGERLTVRSIDRHFDDYLKASGIAGKPTPHTIRHTIATHWLENGMDIKTIQAMLGHSSLATTTIYTHVSPVKTKEVHKELHPHG